MSDLSDSSFAQLQASLDQYQQYPHHHDDALRQKLQEAQAWQRERMTKTHAELFAPPKQQAFGSYLFDQLYGGEQFDQLAKQIGRITRTAGKLEKFIPANALATGVEGVRQAVEAIGLDVELAQYLLTQNLPVNDDTMLAAYRAVNKPQARHQQIDALVATCYQSDKYLRSFVMQKSFALAKPVAYKYQFGALYDFIAKGFEVIRPIKSVGDLMENFAQKEHQIINNVHSGQPDPFNV
ncbi:hypothetical protein ACF3NV_00190 [Moraxella atlantae]|uniref:FFLEELY motif protein n=1 Tax=Faucicola atlantae TaxID=34059 RepID=UPI0037503330